MTLLRSDSATGPFDVVPDGSPVMSPANRANPDSTNDAGHFGWDVIAGYYKVQAEKIGCHAPGDAAVLTVNSDVLTIPPPVADLVLVLDCAPDGQQTIAFDPLADTHYGDLPFTAAAVATSGLAVSFTAGPSEVCNASGTDGASISSVGVGLCIVTAHQAGDTAWLPAPDVSRSFNVFARAAVVHVTPMAVQYSDPVPNLNVVGSITGLVGSDSLAGVLSGCTAPSLGISGGAVTSGAGGYPLAGCTGLSNPHYSVSYSGSVLVGAEDANVAYTGPTTTLSGSVGLGAQVTQSADGSLGDVSNATVELRLFRAANPGPAPDVTASATIDAAGVALATVSLTADTYRVVARITLTNAYFTGPESIPVNLVVSTATAPGLRTRIRNLVGALRALPDPNSRVRSAIDNLNNVLKNSRWRSDDLLVLRKGESVFDRLTEAENDLRRSHRADVRLARLEIVSIAEGLALKQFEDTSGSLSHSRVAEFLKHVMSGRRDRDRDRLEDAIDEFYKAWSYARP